MAEPPARRTETDSRRRGRPNALTTGIPFICVRPIVLAVVRRTLTLLGTLGMLAACAGAAVPSAAPSAPEGGREAGAVPGEELGRAAGSETRPKRLRVLGTNDFHGHLRPTTPEWAEGREVGGAAALAAYMDSARAAVDAPTILLDGGDVMQGTPLSNLTHGRSTVDFYNLAGYTAAAFGNHEFDWGVDTLAARVRQSRFAWLGANIKVKGTDTLPSWSRAVHTATLPGCAAGPPACDSVRVGIIGIITRTTPIAALPSYVAPFDFEDEAAAIDRWVPRLREEGADFVIVAAHEGAYCNVGPSEDCRGPMFEIVPRLRHPPDLIVSGHSHTVLDIAPGGVPVVQSGSHGARLTVVDLERVAPDRVVVLAVEQPVTYVDEVDPDPAIAAMLDQYAAEIGPILDRVVAVTAEPLTRSGGEWPLGNLIADAQRHAVGADVAIMNNGGIRTGLPAGEVRYEEIFRVQPFGNTLVLLDLTGVQLLEAVEHALRGGRAGGHFSGLRVRFDPAGEPGRRVRAATLESGAPVLPDAVYRVTVNNFLAEGGDGYAMLLEGENPDHTGVVDLDALIDYLAQLPSPVPLPAADRIVPVSSLP